MPSGLKMRLARLVSLIEVAGGREHHVADQAEGDVLVAVAVAGPQVIGA